MPATIEQIMQARDSRPQHLRGQWAADRLTMLDVAIANAGDDGLAELIDETTGSFPEFTLLPARPIRGTTYKSLVRVALPQVNFRDPNEGTDAKKGKYANRQFDCHILDPRWEADKMVADADEDGPEAVLAMAAGDTLEASFQHIARQFYYGLGNDAKGFGGLVAGYDRDNFEVDAAGTTDNTASSVWAIRIGRLDLQWLFGNGADLMLSPVRIGDVNDANGKPFEAYIQGLKAWLGLKISSTRSIGRIKNLTEDSGKGLTDDRIAELLNKFPEGRGPDVLLMTKRSREQLRQSRVTALITSPPIPTESHGVPIRVSDALTDTEALDL